MTPHEARREARRVGRMTAAEWAAHRRRVKAERGRDEEPEVLGPAIAFSDRRVEAARRRALMPERLDEETGPQSRTVTDRLLLACAGWTETPSAAEFYDALRADEPTVRQRSIVLAWLQEATDDELWYAHIEDAYSWRQLTAAIQACGIGHFPRCRQINALSTL